MTPRTGRPTRRRTASRRPHPVLLASRPEGPDAEASALVDLLDDALAHGTDALSIDVDGRSVGLSNLTKRYFPQGGPGAQTKGDMLRYYLAVAPVILPHLAERAVVLTRYPDGAGTKGFYVQRAPEQRPAWVTTCTTSIDSASVPCASASSSRSTSALASASGPSGRLASSTGCGRRAAARRLVRPTGGVIRA